MKACPYCAEQIQDAAILCRFCGRSLTAALPASAHGPPARNLPPRAPPAFVLLAILGAFALVAFYVWGTSGASFDLNNSNNLIAMLSGDKLMANLKCGDPSTVEIDPLWWVQANASRQRDVMDAVSRHCYEETRAMKVEVYDTQRRHLASFDGWKARD